MTVAALDNPVNIHFGRSSADRLAALVEPPTLVVCGCRTFERVDEVRGFALPGGHERFAGVTPNPGPPVIARALEIARALGPRTIVGLGGGSAMDVAKIVAALLDRPDLDLFELPAGLTRRVRLVQVPTTAGTGAEVTRWASVWPTSGDKRSVDNDVCYADEAVIDPSLTETMGPRLTAATGLDAFAHAVESIWGRHHRPASDALAARALHLIRAHLGPAVSAPAAEHRDAMAQAALLAGLALSQCRSAAAHALSYGLTSGFGIEHGLAVGLLCRALLPSVAARDPERAALVVGALGAESIDDGERFVDDILRRIGLEPSLRALGVEREALPALATKALGASRLGNQPGTWTREDLLEALTRIA